MCDSVDKSRFVVYNLEMKTALIIGGTSGIGSAIADVLNDEHEVIRIGRNEWNFVTEPCPFDLPSFDVLVFSAGAEFGGDQNFVTQPIDDTELTLQTNLKRLLLCGWMMQHIKTIQVQQRLHKLKLQK